MLIIDLRSIDKAKKALSQIEKYQSERLDEKAFTDYVYKAMKRGTMRRLLKELSKYPMRRKYPADYPISFASDKQRKYVMAKLKGKPYNRTLGMARGWYFTLQFGKKKRKQRNNGGDMNSPVFPIFPTYKEFLYILVGNEQSYASQVTGFYGMGDKKSDVRDYMKPVMGMHIKTGWTPAHRTISKYSKRIYKELGAAIKSWQDGG